MLKVAYLTDGREWSYGIASALAGSSRLDWELKKIFVKKEPPYPIQNLGVETLEIDPQDVGALFSQDMFKPFDVLLVYGWSWILPRKMVEKMLCICNHPSPLPKYRGGTPIQNQIQNGETSSMISLFRMQAGIDDGPLYAQGEFSLEGHLDVILKRMEEVGTRLTFELLEGLAAGTLTPRLQREEEVTSYGRRKPADSELTPILLKTLTGKELWNFTRMLEDPYPNAFIVRDDGKKLFIKRMEQNHDEKANVVSAENLPHLKTEALKSQTWMVECCDGEKLLLAQWEIH